MKQLTNLFYSCEKNLPKKCTNLIIYAICVLKIEVRRIVAGEFVNEITSHIYLINDFA